MARTASLARSRTCLCGASPLSGCGAPVWLVHARTTTLCLAIFERNVAGALTQNVLIARSAFDLTTIDLLSQRFERYSAQSSTWSGDMKRISFASSSSRWTGLGCMFARREEGAVRRNAESATRERVGEAKIWQRCYERANFLRRARTGRDFVLVRAERVDLASPHERLRVVAELRDEPRHRARWDVRLNGPREEIWQRFAHRLFDATTRISGELVGSPDPRAPSRGGWLRSRSPRASASRLCTPRVRRWRRRWPPSPAVCLSRARPA